MGTWVLFVDESGNFRSSDGPLVVGGWLLEGYASQQLATVLRRAVEGIFVGVPYPPHAAHHNRASSLLFEPLRSGGVAAHPALFAEAVSGAYEAVRDATDAELATLRKRIEGASTLLEIGPDDFKRLDGWLTKRAPMDWRRLRELKEQQAAGFCASIEHAVGPALSRRHTVVAAWKAARTAPSTDLEGDSDYFELFETMLERALAFVADRDVEGRLFVRVSERKNNGGARARLAAAKEAARAHPLLGRTAKRPAVIDVAAERYDHRAHPGFVLADFMMNRVRYAMAGPTPWRDVVASTRARTGLLPTAPSRLVRTSEPLPTFSGTTADRRAVREASEGGLPTVEGTATWAREQAALWIAAITERQA